MFPVFFFSKTLILPYNEGTLAIVRLFALVFAPCEVYHKCEKRRGATYYNSNGIHRRYFISNRKFVSKTVDFVTKRSNRM